MFSKWSAVLRGPGKLPWKMDLTIYCGHDLVKPRVEPKTQQLNKLQKARIELLCLMNMMMTFVFASFSLSLLNRNQNFAELRSSFSCSSSTSSAFAPFCMIVTTSENYRLFAQVMVINVNDKKQGPQNASLIYTMSHRPITLWESSLKRDRLISICSYFLQELIYTNFTTVTKRFNAVVKHRT